MNQIQDPANNNYDAGLDFNYAVWTANTDITLTNVPWDNNYRDVVAFESTNALNNYIDSRTSDNTRIANASYAKADEPIMLDIPFNQALRFNYIRVYNPAQPVNASVGGLDAPRYFYYFILNARYHAPNTTEIIVQLDVYQTYVRNVQFGRCYVERGHLGIANADNFRNYGRDYLTVPEGLDTGSDYISVIERGDDRVMYGTNGGYSILVASTIKLEGAPGTKTSPNLNTAEGGTFQGMPSGASYYLFTSSADFLRFMKSFSDKPWITQGIISITVIPYYTRYFNAGSLGSKLSIGAYKAPSVQAFKEHRNTFNNWRDDINIRNYIPARYRHLKKFYTFPYMAIELTNLSGQSSILKPELWNSPHAMIGEDAALLPPNQRIMFYPEGYKSLRVAAFGAQNGVGPDHGVNVSNFPALALVNNGAILALANSAHSRAFGYQSADWSQQRALRSNEVAYDQASAGINAGTDMTENQLAQSRAELGIGNDLSTQQAITNSVGGTATGAGMGAFAGPAGAAVGAAAGLGAGIIGNISTMITQNANNQRYAAQALGARGANDIASRYGSMVRDTNKSLSDWAARGDYENTIAGLNARTRDMELTPPSAAGQAGGELLNILNYRFGYMLRWLMPDQASIQTVGEYWLRYGYAVQRFAFLPPRLMAMTKFTYWKLKETYIRTGAIPEGHKQALRGILEKGVTVWNSADDIGMIDTADNRPLPGIVIDGYVPPAPDPEPDPEPPTPIAKRRRKKMIVYGTVSTVPGFEGNIWALAGTSPGTQSNWIETQDPVRMAAFLDATGQESSVGLSEDEFYAYSASYLSPIQVENPGGEGDA